METILFLTHADTDGTLPKSVLESLTAAAEIAKQLQGTLIAGIFGAKAQAAAALIANCGAQKFFAVDGDDFSQPRYASDIAACEAIARAVNAAVLVAPQTSRMSRIIAGLAHRLKGEVDTHVTGFATTDGKLAVNRCCYRQRIETTFSRAARPWCLLIENGSFAAYSGAPAAAVVEQLTVTLPESARRTVVQGMVAPPADQQTIRPDAKLLFVAGAGWTKKQKDGQPHLREAEKHILNFLKFSKASLGGSKSLVDLSGEGQAVLGFMTHLNQVGQTGATPRHPKGLSTCCHGEEPHVVGWRFITERRAINLDPNCGWARGKADVLYVADAFEVMTKVNELLASEAQPKEAATTA